MNGFELSMLQTFSIAGSTFAIGVTLGWVMALLYIGGTTTMSDCDDKED